MNRVIMLTVAALLLVLVTSALAFSLTLQGLHVNAASFNAPGVKAVEAAAMTSADEAQVGQPSGEMVRMDVYTAPVRLCERDKASDGRGGF